MKQEYHNLPEFYKALGQKAPFLRAVARRCGVSLYSVKVWCYGDGMTKNDAYLQVLEEETGISKENLWRNDNQVD